MFDCFGNQLTSLNVSGCTSLIELNCYENKLTALNASGCSALENLDCSLNPMYDLNLSGCTELYSVDCRDSILGSLNINGCTSLMYLHCKFNIETVNNTARFNVTGFKNKYNLDGEFNASRIFAARGSRYEIISSSNSSSEATRAYIDSSSGNYVLCFPNPEGKILDHIEFDFRSFSSITSTTISVYPDTDPLSGHRRQS